MESANSTNDVPRLEKSPSMAVIPKEVVRHMLARARICTVSEHDARYSRWCGALCSTKQYKVHPTCRYAVVKRSGVCGM